MARSDNYIAPKDKGCIGCVYLREICQGLFGCYYCLDTGHSRGCPPGEGCTKKTLKRRRKRNGKT